MAVLRTGLCLALAAVAASPAFGCDCMTLYPGSPKFGTDLDRIVQFYPVVAEGVLEADGPYAWRFRTTREYRGPGKSYYRVELASDCSLAPNEMKDLIGKPVFLLLSGGPERYEAGRCVNLLGGDVTAAIRDRYVESCVAR